MKDIDVFSILDKWAEKKIDGKTFNEVFQVDGIPAWYFLGPLIKCPVPLFRPLKSRLEIEDSIKKNILPSGSEGLKTGFFVFSLKKGFAINERIKSFFSGPKKRRNSRPEMFYS